MKSHTAFCSACDRQVKVLVRAGYEPDDPESLVCLAYGEECTGAMCPLFTVPTEIMRANYEEAKGHLSGHIPKHPVPPKQPEES